MNGLSNLDAVYIALAFLVPGFVFSAVRNQFVTGQEKQGTEQFLRFLAFSAINYAICGAPIYWALSDSVSGLARGFLWFFVLLVTPAALGVLNGIAIQRGWTRRMYQLAGLNPVHVVPTAWDYKFGGMPGEWVMVTLKNGTVYAGFLGSQSFSSSDPKERDLYVQQLFDVDEEKNWHRTTKSVLIAAGEISTIEFWPVESVKEESSS